MIGRGKHKVRVSQRLDRRAGALYLRWRDAAAANWRVRALALTLVDAKGKPLAGKARAAVLEDAMRAAELQYAVNSGHAPAPARREPSAAPPKLLTVADGIHAVQDAERGRYHAPTRYNKGVIAAATQAMAVWGPDTPLAHVRRDDFVRLWRARMAAIRADGGVGYAGAMTTIERTLRLLDELREMQAPDGSALLGEDQAVPPRKWKEKLRRDYAELYGGGDLPEVQRPRYQLGEYRALLAKASEVDPRLALAMAIGAELRPVQVLRVRRSQLTLPPLPDPLPPLGQDDAVDYGSVVVKGRGKKGGVTVYFTRGQRAAVEAALHPETGYLRALEREYQAALAEDRDPPDYVLVPAGRLAQRDPAAAGPRAGAKADAPAAPLIPTAPTGYGKQRVQSAAWVEKRRLTPLNERTMNTLFHRARELAGVREQPGLAWYGMRRAATDAADDLEVSAGALMHLGGWSNEQTPRDIYRERERETHRRAARAARAAIRGEDEPPNELPNAETDA
ncbi:hypothetical protein J421_5572 (plasmid) [Gemmatirosa kalamazoonensis]|uniref:Integrase family protein n=3 Tax=Gemmatirosa kalamazoonensis TaxID=861299 RepID=W0RM58_9BACT|nr:hypothetical protein J421_4619 [Gemmatirosa kalamazoonensis]AHG93107.1 hypothetical protein J421_5572 [Gemmatirosa kalamazoonensis]